MGSVVLNGATSGATTITPTDGVTATLTLPSTTGTLLTSSGAISNLAGGSNGTIPYQSASGTTQMLAVGTSGQVLQTNGAGAPSWVTPSSGAMTKISTQTGSSVGNILFTSGISSTYTKYRIIIENFWDTGGSSFGPGLQFYSGSSIDTNSAYGYQYIYSNGISGVNYYGQSSNGYIRLAQNTTGGTVSGAYYIVIDFSSINNISSSWQIYGTFQTAGASGVGVVTNNGAFSFLGQSGNGGPVLGFNIFEYGGGTGAFNAKVTLYGIQS